MSKYYSGKELQMRHKKSEISVVFVIIWFVFVTFIVQAEVDPDSIMAMWLFDEGSGETAKDSSPNVNDAVFNGGVEWTTGKFGHGILFNGSDGYLSAQDSDSLDIGSEAMSIVAWLKADGWPSGWNHIVRKTPENPRIYILGVHNTSLPFIFLKTETQQVSDIIGATSLPDGEWIHLAMTYDGAEVKIYVNGELDASTPATGIVEASEGELRIGRGDPAGYFSGILDEIAIFNIALDQDEIKNIMNGGFIGLLPVESKDKICETWAKVKRF
ncbi:hypothetical protein GF312_16465 [Candidatus Poribacteria bacterium]|nr:hypothetical protein [Candidatus Poribacteria bacterium]